MYHIVNNLNLIIWESMSDFLCTNQGKDTYIVIQLDICQTSIIRVSYLITPTPDVVFYDSCERTLNSVCIKLNALQNVYMPFILFEQYYCHIDGNKLVLINSCCHLFALVIWCGLGNLLTLVYIKDFMLFSISMSVFWLRIDFWDLSH